MERDLRAAAPLPTPNRSGALRHHAQRLLAAGGLALLLGAALPAVAQPDPCPAEPAWESDEPDAVNPGLGSW